MYNSPRGRMEACRTRRDHNEYHSDLPLTPIQKNAPCRTPECTCEMKHFHLANQLGLASPSQVERARSNPRPSARPARPPLCEH